MSNRLRVNSLSGIEKVRRDWRLGSRLHGLSADPRSDSGRLKRVADAHHHQAALAREASECTRMLTFFDTAPVSIASPSNADEGNGRKGRRWRLSRRTIETVDIVMLWLALCLFTWLLIMWVTS